MNELVRREEHHFEDFNKRNLIPVDADKFHQFINMVEKMKDRLDELEQKEREYKQKEYDLDEIIERIRG